MCSYWHNLTFFQILVFMHFFVPHIYFYLTIHEAKLCLEFLICSLLVMIFLSNSFRDDKCGKVYDFLNVREIFILPSHLEFEYLWHCSWKIFLTHWRYCFTFFSVCCWEVWFQFYSCSFVDNLFFPAWVIEFFQFIFSFIKFYIICLI